MSLTVIVPFYNEEKYLASSVTNLVETNIADKIILVDDNSFDKSLEIGKNLERKYKNITLLKKNKNEGKGSCIKFAIDMVNTEFVIVHDADLEQDPRDILKLYQVGKKNINSLIIGSRVLNKTQISKRYALLTFANILLTRLFYLLHFYFISDISSGYILTPVVFIKNIKLKEKGFGFEVELLSKFIKYNRSIIEVPIKYKSRSYSEGKKIKLKDGLNIFLKIIYYRFFN